MSRTVHENAHNRDQRKKPVCAPFGENLMEIHDNMCPLIKTEVPAFYNFILQNNCIFQVDVWILYFTWEHFVRVID